MTDKSQVAFPTSETPYKGITLRDYFARQTLCNWPISERALKSMEDGEQPNFAFVAKFCYRAADAMLKARKDG